ncbi:hypothetical protein L249_1086, partial [Ophiocordyceps polyrhachis-furcata BCC 54312]
TRPEGLGGLRNAGPAAAGPRPPYEAATAIATATLYSGYGCTGRTGPAAAGLEGLFNYRLLRGGEDEGPALADLATFFLPTAGELIADSTLFFFDLCGRYGYGYGKRPRCYSPSTASSFPLEQKHAFFYRKVGPGPGPGPNESIEHSYGTRPEGLGGSRDAGPAAAGPRPPYVIAAVRGGYGYGYGYAVQRLRPYGPYGPYKGRNVG